MKYLIIGIVFYIFIAFVLWHIRPGSAIHQTGLFIKSRKNNIICAVFCAAAILLSVLPMGLSPIWNGEIPEHRNQYELMADAVLDGHFYFDYEIDANLLEMDNPYDPQARRDLNVDFHWDHAFYQGKYYMYFGIVPVFLTFIPYKLLTGGTLTTYHATQIFVCAYIFGLFCLFRLLSKKFFKTIPTAIYALCSFSFSLMSIWYIADAPALYCTAIAAAICLEIWSLYFLVKAVYDSAAEKRAVINAVLGAFLGALVFGCRPPIALANLLVVPLIAVFIRRRRGDQRLWFKIAAIAVPYIIVAILLMWYNYARFENPFEFGQSYQLTTADQTAYVNFFRQLDLKNIVSSISYYLVGLPKRSNLLSCGVLWSFPIILFSVILILKKKALSGLREQRTLPFLLTAIGSIFIILVFDVAYVPYPIPRYRMDFYWLLALITFILIGFGYEASKNRRSFSAAVSLFACLSITASIVLYLVPYDSNFTEYYALQPMTEIKRILTLGFLT